MGVSWLCCSHSVLGVVIFGLVGGVGGGSRMEWTGFYPVEGGGWWSGDAIFPIFAILYNFTII